MTLTVLVSQELDCDKLVQGKAPHRLARQFTRPEFHRECVELDEAAAAGLQGHQFAPAAAGDQGAVDAADGQYPVFEEPG